MNIRVEEYIRADDSNPYRSWFDDLDVQAATKVTTALLRLELGNLSRAPLKIELKSTTVDCSAIISERNRFECQNRVI